MDHSSQTHRPWPIIAASASSQTVVDYCEQIMGEDQGQDRSFALTELRRQLAPGPELQIARSTVAALPSPGSEMKTSF